MKHYFEKFVIYFSSNKKFHSTSFKHSNIFVSLNKFEEFCYFLQIFSDYHQVNRRLIW